MEFAQLLSFVDEAITTPAPPEVMNYCGQYYSPYYHLLYLIARRTYIGQCVELGVEGGRGINAILCGLPELLDFVPKVIGIDSNKKPELETLINNDPILFEFILGSSLPPPQKFANNGKSIGLLHVDTEHSFAQAREEFNAYKEFLFDGAVVLFDDTNAMDGDVRRFVEMLPYEKFFDDRLHPSCGYGGIIYREQI
jgi:methyltransferase family protein